MRREGGRGVGGVGRVGGAVERDRAVPEEEMGEGVEGVW